MVRCQFYRFFMLSFLSQNTQFNRNSWKRIFYWDVVLSRKRTQNHCVLIFVWYYKILFCSFYGRWVWCVFCLCWMWQMKSAQRMKNHQQFSCQWGQHSLLCIFFHWIVVLNALKCKRETIKQNIASIITQRIESRFYQNLHLNYIIDWIQDGNMIRFRKFYILALLHLISQIIIIYTTIDNAIQQIESCISFVTWRYISQNAFSFTQSHALSSLQW